MSDGTISKHSLGGVLYSYAAMERMMSQLEVAISIVDDAGKLPDTNSFVGLTWMSVPDAPLIDPLLSQFYHLDHSAGLWNTQELTNRVQLVYHPVGPSLKGADAIPERTEHCPNILPELTSTELTPAVLSSLDALFINMISGYDVSLETLETALDKAERRPYVHLDIHSLVLGPLSERVPGFGDRDPGNWPFGSLPDPGPRYPGSAPRTPHGVREWKRWLNLADSVQMNEFEARWLGDPEITSEEELLRFIEHHRESLRTHEIIITRGKRGASLYEVQTGEVHYTNAPSPGLYGEKDCHSRESGKPDSEFSPNSNLDSRFRGNDSLAPLPQSTTAGEGSSVRNLNPTGCGDVFGSAYVFALLSGRTPNAALEEAIHWASWNATLSNIEEMLTIMNDEL
jgi:hypothetical protein